VAADYVVAIDAGTTGITVLLVDHDGGVARKAYREFPQYFPKPGWVEHDPEEIWEATLVTLAEATSGLSPSVVAAIGITNQRETTVVWDRSSLKPVHNAIVWQCRRSAPICEELRAEGFEAEVRARTGLVTDPYFSGTKITWLMRDVPGLRQRAVAGDLAFGTVDSWLIAKLTGGEVHATDFSNASRTLLFNVHDRGWDPVLLDRMEVAPSLLPTVLPSSGRFGLARLEMFGGTEIPISGVAGDQQAALFGQACFNEGMSKNTYGTGSFVLTNVGSRDQVGPGGLLTTIAWSIDGKVTYALEGSIFITGAAIQWLRDGLQVISAASEAGPLASSVPDTGGVFFVPALVGLGAPHWDPYARGTVTGITRGTTKAHLVRAAVEAMAYQTRDVVEVMTAESGVGLSELRVDGGAAVMDVLCQFQSNILGVPVARPAFTETTGMGAAYLAGIAEGFWSGRDEVASQWKLDRMFEPRMDAAQGDALYVNWKRAVERSLSWATE
jgi:glycerol kinase